MSLVSWFGIFGCWVFLIQFFEKVVTFYELVSKWMNKGNIMYMYISTYEMRMNDKKASIYFITATRRKEKIYF